MEKRARFVDCDGREIFFLDCTNCKAADIHEMIDECARQVRSRPKSSVLTLTIVGGGKFDQETIGRLKELTAGNAPYVKKAAIVGMTGLYKVVLMAVATFSKREFHLFDTVEEARAYLLKD